jgi:hypothetical protein
MTGYHPALLARQRGTDIKDDPLDQRNVSTPYSSYKSYASRHRFWPFSTIRGILVEVWKITKVINFKYHPPAPGQTFPSFTFEDKKELSEDEKRTREYDALAFRIVGAVAVPVLMAYAAYSRESRCGEGRGLVVHQRGWSGGLAFCFLVQCKLSQFGSLAGDD